MAQIDGRIFYAGAWVREDDVPPDVWSRLFLAEQLAKRQSLTRQPETPRRKIVPSKPLILRDSATTRPPCSYRREKNERGEIVLVPDCQPVGRRATKR